MKKTEYTSKDITALGDIEHIQYTPEMYIGCTEHPTHLIYEVVDNALDESTSGHADIIGIQIDDKTNTVCIADNGRGIPFDNNTVELITTKLFSGGKFKKGKENVYGIAIGLHGAGLVAVTALSEFMEIEIIRDGKKAYFRFDKAKLTKKEIIDFTGDKPFSTQISFKPDKKYFQSLNFDLKSIKNRMQLASVHIDHLRLILDHNGTQEIINCKAEDYFNENLKDETDKKYSDTIHLNYKHEDEELDVRFCWCYGGRQTAKNLGSVNLLGVNQGTHINVINELVRDIIFEQAEKNKIKIQKIDCLIGFRCYTSLFLYEPKYSSQTKERLAIRKEQMAHLSDKIKDKFEKFLKENENFKNEVLFFLESYRKKINAAENIIKADENKFSNRISLSMEAKLIDCSSNDVRNCELFLVEGGSAGGSLKSCRNPKFHAIMPLKGKVMNVCSSTKEYFKNKEIVEMINALGCGVEDDCNLDLIKYHKVIIATDADDDGKHISCLLMILFLKLLPKIIQNGYLYISELPLYGVQTKDKFVPLYTEEEKEKYIIENPNVKISRYKGLGEMNPDQLKVCLLDPQRKLFQVPYPENDVKEYLFDLMVKSELKRELV